MKPIVEDFSSQTREQVAARQARAVAGVLAETAAKLANGDAGLATLLLATALGQLTAQTGADLDLIRGIIERERDLTRALLDHQNALWKQQADA